MAILKDSYYESMDPISQMVEPWVSPILDVAESLPRKYSIPFSAVMNSVLKDFKLLNSDQSKIDLLFAHNNLYLSASELLIRHTDAEAQLLKLDTAHRFYYKDLWDVTMPVNSVSFNLTELNDTSCEDVILHLDEKGLKPDVLKSRFIIIFRDKINKAYGNKEQVKLLVNSLSLNPTLAKGKTNNAVYHVACELSELITADKWRIRSTAVMMDAADAVVRVLEAKQGWGEDLANLVHLKIMTHNNSPIYTFTKVKE
jgi:hypothetical protein